MAGLSTINYARIACSISAIIGLSIARMVIDIADVIAATYILIVQEAKVGILGFFGASIERLLGFVSAVINGREGRDLLGIQGRLRLLDGHVHAVL